MLQKEYPGSRSAHDRTLSIRRVNQSGGTIINIITAVIFFGLIGLGIWWVLKTMGETTEQYTEAMVNTQNKAETVNCQMNMQTIWKNLQMYAIENERFPQSSEEFVQWCGNPRLFQCPANDGEKFIYIPGQRADMSPQNILIYEPKAIHDGLCNVLRINGQIESLTPEELKAAVEQTTKTLR